MNKIFSLIRSFFSFCDDMAQDMFGQPYINHKYRQCKCIKSYGGGGDAGPK